MEKAERDINTIPKDFDLKLALVDAIPVIEFSISLVLVSKLLKSSLFILGALLCLFAGICKVLWKIIVAIKKKNIYFLFVQMRTSMPIGLLLMIVGIGLSYQNLSKVLKLILDGPSIIFFGIGIVLMIIMMIFAFKLDKDNLKHNWLEQTTNIMGQACFLIGLVLLV